MRASNKLVVALLVGGLVLQGCATGDSRPDSAPVASTGQSTAAVAAPAASSQVAVPEKDGKPVVAADTKDNFEAVVLAIQQQMQPGGRFSFVDSRGRQTVENRFADMRTLFDQFGTVDKMNSAAQTKLMDDQNAINEVLARYDNNRVICRNEVPVGTHFPTRVCRTLGQIQQEQNDAQQTMRVNQMRGSEIGGH